MFVSHVTLKNWKNFKSASAELRRRVFLIGPNASGKSNLLDAFRFLRDLAKLGLHAAVEKRESVSAIRCLAARESPAVAIDITLSEESGERAWRYRVEFNQDSSRIPVVRSEQVFDLASGRSVLNRPDSEDREDAPRLTQTALEQINANQAFRAVADFLGSIS